MLSINGRSPSVCNGMTRREALSAGGTGLFGLSLPKILAADDQPSLFLNGRAKSVLFLFLFGGPSQLETFDLKPHAPAKLRGPFQPIASRTPDLLISEHLPRTAQISDKFCVIRTMTHQLNDHGAAHYIQTGHPRVRTEQEGFGGPPFDRDWPAMGSVVNYLSLHSSEGKPRPFPDYVYLPNRLGYLQGGNRPGQDAGWLGRAYNALATNIQKQGENDNPYFRDCTDEELNFQIRGLLSSTEMPLDRLNRRESLLRQFDGRRRSVESSSKQRAYDGYRQRAFSLVTSEKVRTALDIRRESAAKRDRYGRHLFGQSTLVARRILEAGCRFVTVAWDTVDGYSWDSHRNSRDLEKHLLPGFDQAFSAVIEDLEDRGLLDETLVIAGGEMGRSPRPNGAWGRGHWSYCFPFVLAGAGIRGGAAYGRSDKDAAYPADHPVKLEDLAATVYHALGINPETYLPDAQGRPASIVEGGRPLLELFG